MENKLELLDSVREKINTINDGTKKIENLIEQERISVNEKTSAALSTSLNKINKNVSSVILKLHKDLLLLNLPEYTKQSQIVVRNYYFAFQNFHSLSKNKFKRLIHIAHPSLTDDKINVLFENKENFSVLLFEESPSELLDMTVNEIQERYDGIIKLEKTVKEIADLFEIFNFLVNTQQETLNVIQIRIENAKTHTEDATKELKQAENDSNKNNRRRCCILFVVMIIVGAIVAAILL